ncbi:hypothetical protein N9K77_02100 [bacterium]|nr:hypothetical protein [bacterium]
MKYNIQVFYSLILKQNILSENWKNKHQIHTKIEALKVVKERKKEEVAAFRKMAQEMREQQKSCRDRELIKS